MSILFMFCTTGGHDGRRWQVRSNNRRRRLWRGFSKAVAVIRSGGQSRRIRWVCGSSNHWLSLMLLNAAPWDVLEGQNTWVPLIFFFTMRSKVASSWGQPFIAKGWKFGFFYWFVSKNQCIRIKLTCTIASHWSIIWKSMFIPFASDHLLSRPEIPLHLWTMVKFSLNCCMVVSNRYYKDRKWCTFPHLLDHWVALNAMLGYSVDIWVTAWVQTACLKLASSPASTLQLERKSISSLSSWIVHWSCFSTTESPPELGVCA